jgi:hypothetical protein
LPLFGEPRKPNADSINVFFKQCRPVASADIVRMVRIGQHQCLLQTMQASCLRRYRSDGPDRHNQRLHRSGCIGSFEEICFALELTPALTASIMSVNTPGQQSEIFLGKPSTILSEADIVLKIFISHSAAHMQLQLFRSVGFLVKQIDYSAILK